MLSRRRLIVQLAGTAVGLTACAATRPPNADAGTTLIRGGRWFDGTDFRQREAWSVRGLLTYRRPASVDRTLDVAGAFLIPPFADAHNHGIGTGVHERDRAMVDAYLRAGVFYVRSMGNLPLSLEDKKRLEINTTRGPDAVFAQGSITGHGGHPAGLIRDVLLPQGYFPAHTLTSLADLRFYEVESRAELQAKWPLIRAANPDFIKFFLFNSDEYERRRADPAYFGRRGIDPDLAIDVVRMAHAAGMRAAAHVVNVADFRTALASGVDILGHLPAEGELTRADAQRAARQGVELNSTCGFLTRLARNAPAESAAVHARQGPNLRLLKEAGVLLTIGSDDPADPSQAEIEHLRGLNVFSDLELLRMWTGATARAIFPGRGIGTLAEGHEASFLALEGNPLQEWSATQRILLRFKQGQELTLSA